MIFSTTAASFAAVFFLSNASLAGAAKSKAKPPTDNAVMKSSAKPADTYENYKDLIQKAQNLALQHDRLQSSQVLIRAIQREQRGSGAHKELMRALEDLTTVFYTEKAQGSFAAGQSLQETKPREAIDSYVEALRLEDGNVAILKALARAHLGEGECDKADGYVKQAEGLNPFSSEVILLRVQTLGCSKSSEALEAKLIAAEDDLEPVMKFAKGVEVKDLARQKEFKKAKAALASWEELAPGYPEVAFWKFELSRLAGGSVDRSAAVQYSQACQNMTARTRKSFNLDVDLCKGKAAVDTYLKETGLKPAATPGAAE